MKNRKIPLRLAALAIVVFTLAGFAALAADEGTASDPLVSLSYLTNMFKPAVLAEVDTKVAAQEARIRTEFTTELAAHKTDVEDLVSGLSGGVTHHGAKHRDLFRGHPVVGTKAERNGGYRDHAPGRHRDLRRLQRARHHRHERRRHTERRLSARHQPSLHGHHRPPRHPGHLFRGQGTRAGRLYDRIIPLAHITTGGAIWLLPLFFVALYL